MRPVINRRKCPAQKDMCKAIEDCATGAFYYVEDEEEPLGGRIEINYTFCNACGLCALACCGQAVEMVADGMDLRESR